jgi:Ca2+-binding RTX toxin-like protein
VDTLIGGAGNDTYNVSNPGDVIVEAVGGGTDTVVTTIASYTLGANLENLTHNGAGSFIGTGNALANVITGGAGADTLDGGKNTAGGDRLVGGGGDDTYIVRNPDDVVVEAPTGGLHDTVLAAVNTYTLADNVENLTFIGTGAFTGTGNRLSNVITGGAGADILTGGGGADTFVLAKGNANGDLITDFTQKGGNGPDHLTFTGYAAAAILVKTAAGTGANPTSYAVQLGGITQDTFRLTGNVTLAAADYKFA